MPGPPMLVVRAFSLMRKSPGMSFVALGWGETMENDFYLDVKPVDVPDQKRSDEAKVRLARMSWVIPLAFPGLAIFINIVAKPIGAVGGFIFVGGVVVGFLLALFSLAWNWKFRGVIRHAVGGLATSITLALLIAAMVWALAKVRSIQEKQRQERPRIEPSSRH